LSNTTVNLLGVAGCVSEGSELAASEADEAELVVEWLDENMDGEVEGSGANVSEGQSSSVPDEKNERDEPSRSESSPNTELSLICAAMLEDKKAELVGMLLFEAMNELAALLPVRIAMELGVFDKKELHSVSMEASEGGVKSSRPAVSDMPLSVGEAISELTEWKAWPCIMLLDWPVRKSDTSSAALRTSESMPEDGASQYED
jgi:hypothetical protein